MSKLAFQRKDVDAQESLDKLDSIFHCSVTLRFVGLRLLLQSVQMEPGQDQISQCQEGRLIVGLENDLVAEPEAADSCDSSVRRSTLVEDGTSGGDNPSLNRTALALLEDQDSDELRLVVTSEKAVVHHDLADTVILAIDWPVRRVVLASCYTLVAPTPVGQMRGRVRSALRGCWSCRTAERPGNERILHFRLLLLICPRRIGLSGHIQGRGRGVIKSLRSYRA